MLTQNGVSVAVLGPLRVLAVQKTLPQGIRWKRPQAFGDFRANRRHWRLRVTVGHLGRAAGRRVTRQGRLCPDILGAEVHSRNAELSVIDSHTRGKLRHGRAPGGRPEGDRAPSPTQSGVSCVVRDIYRTSRLDDLARYEQALRKAGLSE
jgi:hypothetical protein